jgi:transcription antitermination factor NusG
VSYERLAWKSGNKGIATVSTVLASIPASWQESRWYALSVRCNQEKRVTEHLKGRDIEHFLPSYQSVRQWKDRRVKFEMPLFPGYLFVHLPLAETMKAVTVPNVVSLVGTRNSPSAISEDEIMWIRSALKEGKAEPHDYLKVGEQVRITAGIMAGMEGILLRRGNSTRVVVSVDSIARSFVVEVEAAWVARRSDRFGKFEATGVAG